MNAKLAALLGAIGASVMVGVLGGCVAESADDEDEGPTAQTAAALDPTPLKSSVGTPVPTPKTPPPVSVMESDPDDPDPSPWDPPSATVSSQPGGPQPVSNN